MPAPGDQHKPNGTATHNPFEEVKPHINEYTAQEIATLQSRLNKRLGPEYIATRAGPGNSKVAYLPAEKAINLANEVFGFNGWSSSIQNIQIDFVDENPTKGTISIGLSVVVRVTLRDGTYHEDTGYGGIENCKSKIAAFEKAKKEGTTDALKRALRNFGNVLGNCIYDKDFITKVSKVKAGQSRWDVNELHRHQDFAPKKEEEEKKPISNIPHQQAQPPRLVPEESFDVNEFDEADFDDLGNPDEVLLPPDTGQPNRILPQQHAGRIPPHNHQTPSKPPQARQNQPQYNPQGGRQSHQPFPETATSRPPPQQAQDSPATTLVESNRPQSRSSSPGVAPQHFALPPVPAGPQSIGFFSARAADGLDGNNNPVGTTAAPKFNPYAESPSIRKTSGVDHSKSMRLNGSTLKPEPPMVREDAPQPLPADQGRKIGTPGQIAPGVSPSIPRMSTSAYRPPTRQGPTSNVTNSGVGIGNGERNLVAAKRAPLEDLSNMQQSGRGTDINGGETKRQRIGPGLSGYNENQTNTAAPG